MAHHSGRPLVSLIALLLVPALLTVSRAEGSQHSKQGGSATFAISVRLVTMNLNKIQTSVEGAVTKHMFTGLTDFDPDMKIVPDLATSWTVSPDATVWTFKLRRGVKFSDGTPFNAEAVRQNLERTRTSLLGGFKSILETMTPIDDHTIRITTKGPFATLPTSLAHFAAGMVSPAGMSKCGQDIGTRPECIVGAGPYRAKEYLPGERLVMVRNDDYYDQKPYLDRITVVSVVEDTTRLAMLQSGEADLVANVSPQLADAIRNDRQLTLSVQPSVRSVYVGFNVRNRKWADPRVRQALNYAVDKDAIVKNILKGFGEPLRSAMARVTWGFAESKVYAYNKGTALQLLQDAGWKRGADGMLVNTAGEKFQVKLLGPVNRWLADKETAQAVAGYLKDIGIAVTLDLRDFASYFATLKAKTAAIDNDLFMASWGPPTADAWYGMIVFETAQFNPGLNFGDYSNPQVDSLLRTGMVTVDPTARAAAYKTAQQIVTEDAPWIFLASLSFAVGARANLKGFEVPANEYYRLRYAFREGK